MRPDDAPDAAGSDAPPAFGGHRPHGDSAELVALDVYRRELLARIGPLEPIRLRLAEAHGCVLAEDIDAPADVPVHAGSAMDGYAVRAADATAGATLQLIGEAAAGGAPTPPVGPGQAVRIMTGGVVPEGADAIVPVEVAEELPVPGDAAERVVIAVAPSPGDHVRAPGEDVRAGSRVLSRGRRLGAADVGMLAAVGRPQALVHPRPRVVVMATGDEVVEPDAQLAPGQVRDSGSYALAALARDAGATVYRHAIVRDDRRALQEAFEGALIHADLLVTSGGVSAGRYDLVKEVLGKLGDVEAHKVGMQPGMPQAFGFLGAASGRRVPCFGLPGNPVSSYVSFEVFVRPAIRRLQGRPDLNRPRVNAVLDEAVSSPRAKTSFLRVKLHREGDVWHATPTGPQGSGILTSLVLADGLAEVPAERTSVDAGERVVVHLLMEG